MNQNHRRFFASRCCEACNGYHVNTDEERIERCDACAALGPHRQTDADAAKFVLSLTDKLVCDTEDGAPITLHSCARRTLGRG